MTLKMIYICVDILDGNAKLERMVNTKDITLSRCATEYIMP